MIPERINVFMTRYLGGSWRTSLCGLVVYILGFIRTYPSLFEGHHTLMEFVVAYAKFAAIGSGLLLARDHNSSADVVQQRPQIEETVGKIESTTQKVDSLTARLQEPNALTARSINIPNSPTRTC